ncbi:hypothetical protein [Sphingorhabdus lacus]|uniref:Uncharacterized protein n=1 Tax=Sphingorhabdus lacus TaxID=392610 RepID=A0A6I6L8Z5_9SPHN|nr:hypothetical protein [Sphingorhabdus lacus]QGY80811.1 hypothetical protein EUU25_09375 [Sphingorhabdus lacus]
MAENEDWWWLCYDTDAKEFYVLHQWDHVQINGLRQDADEEKHDVDTWRGEGAEKIAEAKERLLEHANT